MNVMSKKITESPKSFEEQLKFLEDLTAKLESGELSLTESLEMYEQGLKTVQSAQKTLSQAREKIDFLETQYAGPAAENS